MKYLWISPNFLLHFNEWLKTPANRPEARAALNEIIQAAINPEENSIKPLPTITTAFTSAGDVEWKASYFDVSDVVILFDFHRAEGNYLENQNTDDVRALLIPEEVIAAWVNDRTFWEAFCKGLCDAAFLSDAKKRPETFKFFQDVSSIFLPAKNRRMHMVDLNRIGVNVILGDFDTLLWESHSKTAITIKQPRGTEIDAWERLHQTIDYRFQRIYPTLKWKISASPAPKVVVSEDDSESTWVTREQLKEVNVVEPDRVKAVLSCSTEDDLVQLMDTLSEEQWTKVELLFNRHANQMRRRDEREVGEIAQYELNSVAQKESDTIGYERWLELLTPTQQEVIQKPLLTPIRLKGGPGTGKTLTAVLRASFLLRKAKEQGLPLRLGFIVFNRDLGRKIYQQFINLGSDEFFRPDAQQHLVVTNLMGWCENFLDLGTRNIEPMAPFRNEKTDRQRESLFALTIDEARKRLSTPEYEKLWAEFDIRSTNGVREIETEISQYIKARGITTLTSYLAERRPTQWLLNSDKEFRRFVWEVYVIYNETLRTLRMVDADDLVADCFHETSKTTWQEFEKEKQGFDYLILDEAHDFYRHQIHLLASLVKDERNIMMCFDQGQMVYSRYPTLRDMGYDSGDKFFIRRLEVNFRNSRQVLEAVQALVAAYPVYDYNSLWGQITPNPRSPEGTKPTSQGFLTDTGMRSAAVALTCKYVGKGVDPKEIALICFDDEQMNLLESAFMRESELKVHRLNGQGKRPPRNSIILTTARQVKGEQFDVCILVGTDRDSLPDFRGGEGEVWKEQKREDDFRLVAVAMSRCKLHLHFLWNGTQPSEFIEALADTVDHQG